MILDLEDAVAPSAKPAARDALVATPLDPARTVVRINAEDTEDFAHDLVALRHTGYTTVMLPKTASAERLAVAAELGLHTSSRCARPRRAWSTRPRSPGPPTWSR